ncbi:response regulator transcription factor [bacterium]|nr:response regulator transcription factor [bacterium]
MPPEGLPTIVVAEDFALLRDGIVSICEASGRFRVQAAVADGEAALDALRRSKPQLAVLGLSLTRLFAIEAVKKAHEEGVETRIVIMSPRTDRKTVIEVLRSGAQGYFVSSSGGKSLLDCLDRVAEGGVYVSPEVDVQALFTEKSRNSAADPLGLLSAREYQVFSLLVEGVRAKEIAARLNLSTKTVDTYRASLMRKLDIFDLAGLVKFALQRQIITH